MYTLEQRKRAVELYIRYGLKATATMREPGYHSRAQLASWHKERQENGGRLTDRSLGQCTLEQKRAAARHYLTHGRCNAFTRREPGYLKCTAKRAEWIDEYAPGERCVLSTRRERKGLRWRTWTKGVQGGHRMAYSEEQRRSALETFIRFDHSHADTIAELGYPNRGTLRGWWREYERTGVVPVRKSVSDPTYTDAMKRAAADYYLGHGRSLARTARALGYPKSRQLPGEWID